MFNVFQKKPTGEKLVLKISGMHCTSCAMNIDGALEDTEGVIRAETSYARSEVEVSYNPEVISTKMIVKVLQQLGYIINT